MRVEIRPLVLLPKRLAPVGGFMKFASVPKFALLFAIAGVLTLSLFGCGAAVSNLKVTQGNWAFSASSTAKLVNAPTFVIGGNLTQSGNTLTGTMYIDHSGCIAPQTVIFTGTVKDKNVTLTSQSFSGQVITVTASGSQDSLSGTYTVTGGCVDSGTVTANAVPSISGTWSGTVLVNTSPTTMTVVLTQASTASADGTFALTGSVSYVGSVCPATATLLPSSVTGGDLKINTDNGAGGGFSYVASLDSATAPKSMTGDYDSSSDPCASSDGIQSVTLTKQ
jgi:hypothetical protein